LNYPIKIIERFVTNFVTRQWGLFALPMSAREEQKTNARKLSLALTAAPVTVTSYNDEGGREKRESYGRY
jgi:hypothetical protein